MSASENQANDTLAIIAGAGRLPQLLVAECQRLARPFQIITFAGVDHEDFGVHPVFVAEFEKIGAVFDHMRTSGCTGVVFAGAMQRPALDPNRFDASFTKIAPRLQPVLQGGDDGLLSFILQVFADEGFNVVSAQDVLTDLLAPPGCLTKASPSKEDLRDIDRALEIAGALGEVDVGQGVVVARGLCLGLETVQGTNAMLRFVAKTNANDRRDTDGAKGVLLKCPKLGQDRRVDLPTIGPNSVVGAANAGLAGIAVAAGGVIIIDKAATIAKADALGLFIVALEADAKAAKP